MIERRLQILHSQCTSFEIQTPSVDENGILSFCCCVIGVSEERVEAMFPTAAVTSKMLKSGMTLTQIYNEYVQATDSLQLEKEENKRLNTYLDQILQVRRLTIYGCVHVMFLFMLVYVRGGSTIAGCFVLLVNSFSKTRAVFSNFEGCIQFLFQLYNFIRCLL